MTYEQYWDGDPYIVRYYRDKQRAEMEAMNYKAWLHGLYGFIGFSTAISNINLSGKQQKVNNYLDKPLDIFPPSEEEMARRAEEARQRVIEGLSAFKSAWDAQHNKENDNGNRN